MKSDFHIRGLDAKLFKSYFDMDKAELEKLGIRACVADTSPGYPCRVSLKDAQIGEELLLLNFEHHQTESPYRSSGPIFIKKNAIASRLGINEIPEMLIHRFLSLRSYSEEGMMLGARTINGEELRNSILRIFSNGEVSYIHIHNAGPGCYNCMVSRVLDQ